MIARFGSVQLATALTLVGVLLPGVAHSVEPTSASEPSPSETAAPTASVAAAQASRPLPLFDGFYVRIAAGPVYAGTSVATAQLSHPDYDVSGAGFSVDALAGGSPLPGLATGGAVSFSSFAFGDDVGLSHLLMLGAFVDVFPAKRPWHVGGLLGLAGVGTSTKSGRDEFAGGGLGAAAWAGYDVWLAKNWSLGTMLRLKGAIARDPSVDNVVDSTDRRSSSYELALLVSALYY